MNILYGKWLWQGIKTPSIVYMRLENVQGPGVGRNNRFDLSIFYFEIPLRKLQNTQF